MSRPSDASIAQAVAEIPDGTCMVNIYGVRRRAVAIDGQSDPAADFDCLALIDAARKEFRASDAAGDVLDWLEERYAIAVTSPEARAGDCDAHLKILWQRHCQLAAACNTPDRTDRFVNRCRKERDALAYVLDRLTTKATP